MGLDAMRHQLGEHVMAGQPLRVVGALMIVGLVLAGCTSGHRRAGSSGDRSTASSPASPSRSPAGTSKAPGGVEAPTSSSAAGPCAITSAQDVAAAYHGKVKSESASTSGIGHPLCVFAMSGSNVGAPGRVTVTLNPSQSMSGFAKTKRTASGAVSVSGVGESAFYVPSTGILQFIKGHSAVVVQAQLRVPATSQRNPGVLRSDTIALGKHIAAGL
jgi:hypothetical protein